MDIFVASTSAHKLAAVREASTEVFPHDELRVKGMKAASEINEQPVGHEETVRGALNRLKNLKQVIGSTRYNMLISMENGIFPVKIGDRQAWFDLGWVVVEDANGNQCFAHSTGIEFEAQFVEQAERKGFQTTTVGSIIAERTGADGTDPHAYLTAGKVGRSDMLQQTLKTALGQLFRNRSPYRQGPIN